MADLFKYAYPTICAVLEGSSFDSDVAFAVSIPADEFGLAIDTEVFTNGHLMEILGGAISPDLEEQQGVRLERDLDSVVAALGVDMIKRVFRHKLLEPRKAALLDVCYEIAVASRACAVLDEGTVQLEVPIVDLSRNPRHYKNSDIAGEYEGQKVRIEVTVLHERGPRSVQLGLVEEMQAAKIPWGFELYMREPMQTEAENRDAIALVELLAEHHANEPEQDAAIDGVTFLYRDSHYQSSKGPFTKIVFDDYEPLHCCSRKEVRHEMSVRPMSPRYLRDDSPLPDGVFDTLKALDTLKTPLKEPVSSKVLKMVDGKLPQCESGIVNIVAFGNPWRHDENAVRDALYGSRYIEIPYVADKYGIRLLGKATLERASKAPFRADPNLTEEERLTFITPFQKLSAILHLRMGRSPLAVVIPNQNAHLPIPEELWKALSVPIEND